MSEIINVFAKPATRRMPTGAKLALIIGAVMLALIAMVTVTLGTIGLVSAGTMLVLDIDMMDISFLLEDFIFFLEGYYA